MRGLYALVDVDTLDRRGLDPVRFAAAVLAARPAAIQLRDKSSGPRRTLALLRAIQPLAAAAGVPLFANDRADLALAAGTTGVHVGQEDLPVDLVRSIAPSLKVGLSTHNEAQVDAAIEQAPDYIAIGPVFATLSKDKPSPVVGVEELARLAARVRHAKPEMPIVAIGGISRATLRDVAAHADLVAVIGALVPEGTDDAAYAEVEARSRALHERIVQTRRSS